MKIKYSANNSGGAWWLTDEDWNKLDEAGWDVKWAKDLKKTYIDKDGRYLGALAKSASKDFETPGDAMREFEEVTGHKVTDEGCNCCGPPHQFEWEANGLDFASGSECARYMFGKDTHTDLRSAIEELEELKKASSKWKKLKD